jgi:medium-chain acyl-[acyl-carrier-protein] hydrolase
MSVLAGKANDTWFVRERHIPRPKKRLFCFCYAGGSSQVFAGWQAQFGPDIEVLAVELPGRGRRFPETPVGEIEQLVNALTRAILPLMDRPCYFFGHSNGALLAYEVARSLAHNCMLRPRKLFLAGKRAPQLGVAQPHLHRLPDSDFVESLKRYNGTPEAVLKNEELLVIFLPVLRADFRLGEAYTHRWKTPLDIPASLLGGHDDHIVPEEDLLAWQQVFSHTIEYTSFPGDHFFIHTQHREIISTLREQIAMPMLHGYRQPMDRNMNGGRYVQS